MRTDVLVPLRPLLASLALSILACAPPTPNPPDAGADPDVPFAKGSQQLDSCRGDTGVDEACTLVFDGSGCREAACRKLVVVFSGGEMGCESGSGYGDVLEASAAAGYAAVCINDFETAEGSSVAPYVDEAARIDRAVREATSGAWARHHWTGEELLFEGISHGATAPVILMARTALDDDAHWKGTKHTAGCFFDGSYDQAASAALLRTGGVAGRPCSFPVSYDRWLTRYCGAGATDATCDLATQPKAQADTITEVAPEAFAIRDFKLFECGSEMGACSADIIPGPPVEALCRKIDAGASHACSFTALPDQSHLTCHAEEAHRCRTWFDALVGG